MRKQYKKIVWSVGILDKIILRWRRKGSGLRGFRPDAVVKEPPAVMAPPKEDDYDFLKEGRRQTEERFQKALTRVKSMAQYPEGRDQYRRLLTVVQKCRETKVLISFIIHSSLSCVFLFFSFLIARNWASIEKNGHTKKTQGTLSQDSNPKEHDCHN